MTAAQRAGEFNTETHLKPIIATQLVDQLFDTTKEFDLVGKLVKDTQTPI